MERAAHAIQVERHPAHATAVTIRMNRPQVRNALRMQDVVELGAALLRLQLDATVSVIMVTGADGAFTAGADINDLNRLSGAQMSAYMDATSDILTRVLSMPKVVIALVNGPSAGFGNHFAACADLCFVHESASFNFTGSAKAIPSMLIGAAVMPLSIGTKRAKSLYLRGGRLTATEAVESGLANQCVLQSRWAELPDELAQEFEPKSVLMLAHNKFQVNQAAFQMIGASRLSILAGSVALSGKSDIPTGRVQD